MKGKVGSSILASGRIGRCQEKDLRYPWMGREIRSKVSDSVMAEVLRSTRQPLLKTHVSRQTRAKGKVDSNFNINPGSGASEWMPGRTHWEDGISIEKLPPSDCGVFSGLMIDVTGPHLLWVVLPMGRWSWAV